MVFFLSLYLYETKFLLLSVLTRKETICHRTKAKPLSENGKRLLPVDFRRSKTSLLQLPISWGNQWRKVGCQFSRHDDAQAVAYSFLFHDLERTKNNLLALRAVLIFIKAKNFV